MEITYDDKNIFAKILRGEIYCDKVMESEHSLAFKDVNPRAKIHILVIPKRPYANMTEFITKSSDNEKVDIFNSIREIVEKEKIKDSGYRVITNCGDNGLQEVQHLHFHVLGGQPLGGFIKKLDMT